MAQRLRLIRDRVLDQATITNGDVVLDVGCGDGLIGFGALERVGPSGRVIFADISSDLISRCRATASALASLDRCQFLVTSATDLRDVLESAVGVVTIRLVLIYVDDKEAALREIFRVLRPAGRVSIGEPINQFTYPEPPGVFLGYDCSPISEIAGKLEAYFDRVVRPKLSAMMDFNERHLLNLIEKAGFREIHMNLRIDIQPVQPQPWDRFLETAGNPHSPTIAESMAEALTPAERDRLTKHLRPLVETGAGIERRAFAFVVGAKPSA